MNWLVGYKTYIVALAMMIVGITNMLTGEASGWAMIAENADLLLEGAGLGALRKGVKG